MLLAFSYFHLKVPQSHRISSFSFRSNLRLHLFAHILVSSLYVFHSICYTEENATILYQKHTPPKYCYRLATIVWLTTVLPRTRNSKNRSLLIDKVLPSMLNHLCKAFGSFSKVHDNVTPPLWDLPFIWFIIAASSLVLLPRAQKFHVLS